MKNRKGFTLAELLIVCGIIAILVGISIPIFIRQRHKAVAGTNIANIRAAKISALTGFYIDCIDTSHEGDIFFYEYDIDTGKSVIKARGRKDTFTDWARMYSLGYRQVVDAEKHKVCQKIYVYIQMGKDVTVTTMTSPCYEGYLLTSTETAPFG